MGRIPRCITPADDGLLRKRYGWFPRYALLDDMPELYGRWKEARTPKRDLLGRIWNTLRTRRRLLAAAEIAAAWLVTELLVQMTATQAQFRMVDFRLAFIVLVGTMYGLNAGVLAALLASLSLMLGYLQQGTTPLLLFYDPANWLALSSTLSQAHCAAMFRCKTQNPSALYSRKMSVLKIVCALCAGCIRTRWRISRCSAARFWAARTALAKYMM